MRSWQKKSDHIDPIILPITEVIETQTIETPEALTTTQVKVIPTVHVGIEDETTTIATMTSIPSTTTIVSVTTISTLVASVGHPIYIIVCLLGIILLLFIFDICCYRLHRRSPISAICYRAPQEDYSEDSKITLTYLGNGSQFIAPLPDDNLEYSKLKEFESKRSFVSPNTNYL